MFPLTFDFSPSAVFDTGSYKSVVIKLVGVPYGICLSSFSFASYIILSAASAALPGNVNTKSLKLEAAVTDENGTTTGAF